MAAVVDIGQGREGGPMTTEDTQRSRRRFSWGQAGAAVAGVLSLIFVGWEIRQNTTAIRGSTYQAVADANVDWLMFLAENPEQGRLLQEWTSGDTALSVQEVWQARGLFLMFWRTVENAHYQYLQGNLPEEAVRRWIPPEMFDNPVLRVWWQNARDRFTPAFVVYVDSVVVESVASEQDETDSDPDTAP